jgi:hypothetical protein
MSEREAGKRRRLEGVIPEIIKRAVEVGVGKAHDAPQNIKTFLHDLKVPKEIGSYLLTQVDETKNGVFRVVAKEMRDFLQHTNFAGEMQKILTTVQFEVNTTIRFRPNEPGAPADATEAGAQDARAVPSDNRIPLSKPEVKTQVHVTRAARRERRRQRMNQGGGGNTSGGGTT